MDPEAAQCSTCSASRHSPSPAPWALEDAGDPQRSCSGYGEPRCTPLTLNRSCPGYRRGLGFQNPNNFGSGVGTGESLSHNPDNFGRTWPGIPRARRRRPTAADPPRRSPESNEQPCPRVARRPTRFRASAHGNVLPRLRSVTDRRTHAVRRRRVARPLPFPRVRGRPLRRAWRDADAPGGRRSDRDDPHGTAVEPRDGRRLGAQRRRHGGRVPGRVLRLPGVPRQRHRVRTERHAAHVRHVARHREDVGSWRRGGRVAPRPRRERTPLGTGG